MAFRRRSKSYPFFSQEFLIQNHADIVFCLVVLILIGLMFEATAKTACLFILPQYNTTIFTSEGEVSLYHYGWRDCITIFFYFLITIILHAVVQEYMLDKVIRRRHLSKSKNTKFSESGQLCVFHLVSSVWSLYVIVTCFYVYCPWLCNMEGYMQNFSSLWEDYPHVHLRFQVKFFYLFQLAYWIHTLPELYFQKVRKEEIPRQLTYISLYLLHIALAYLLNLTRVGLVLLFLHYLSELGFYISRLVYFMDESHRKLFDMWGVIFVLTRMVTLTLMVLAVGFGLARANNQALDLEAGNFNTTVVRLAVLLAACLTQAWLLWKFICYQLRRWREVRLEESARRKPATKQQQQQQPALLLPRALKRDAGHHENGVIKVENGASPRIKKLKAP